MTNYSWCGTAGTPEGFSDPTNWIDLDAGKIGVGVPGAADSVKIAALAHVVIGPTENVTLSTLKVRFQFSDENYVWVDGSLRVLDEVLFEDDRGNLRFTGTFTLDGTGDGAAMDVDRLQIGGTAPVSARNVVSVDDDGMLRVLGNALVTTKTLDIFGRGGLEITGGGTVDVTGPVVIHQDAIGPAVSVDGLNSALLVHGDLAVDGYLFFTRGARGTADTATVSSADPASLIVGDFTGESIFSSFVANAVTLGDGQGGFGDLIALGNGQIFIGDSLTLLNPISDAATFSGTLSTFEGGFIEIGGLHGAPANTIQVDEAGMSVGLIGHGMMRTGTLHNDGIVQAQGGLMSVAGNVAGDGLFRVTDGATLEIDGSFGSGATVELTGSFSSLVLDQPGGFQGAIASIDTTDTIRLNKTGSALGNAVQSAVITSGLQGEQFLTIFQDGGLFPINYRISGAASLAGHRFEVTESVDHTSTSLTLTPHGTVTSYYLDNAGKAVVAFIWGDDLGGNTSIFVNPDGSAVGSANGLGDEFGIIDFRNNQLNGAEHYWIAGNGEQAYLKFTYDNSELPVINPAIAVQIPTTPSPGLLHNLWYTFRHAELASITADDGFGHSGTAESVSHFIHSVFDGGLATIIASSLSLVASPPASAVGFGAGQTPEPVGISAEPGFALIGEEWDPTTHVLKSFTTEEYFQGTVNMISSWIRNADGSYTRSDTFPGVAAAPVVGTYDADYMNGHVLPLIASVSVPSAPIMQSVGGRLIQANIGALLVGKFGTPLSVVTGQPLAGAVFLGLNGAALIGQEAVGLIGQDGGSLIGQDGGSLIGQDGGSLIGEDGASLAARDAARLIGQDGGSLIGPDGGSIVPAGAVGVASLDVGAPAVGGTGTIASAGATLLASVGGNLIAGAGGSTVDAGGANMLTLWGTATPGRYAASAVVFADANGSGKLDNGEAWAATDATGHFQLYGGWGTLILVGGVDTGTNLPLTVVLKSPLGSTGISSLTTLASGLADDDGDVDGAIRQLQSALGLNGSVDFTVIDPIAGTENGDLPSAKVYVETAKAMDTVLLIGAGFAGLGANQSKAHQAAFAAMVDTINKNGTLNLSDKATVDGLVTSVGTALGTPPASIAGSIVDSIISTSQLLDKLLADEVSGSGLTDGITMVETAVQGTLVAGLATSAGDPDKLGPAALLLQAASDDGKSVVTPNHVVTITVVASETVNVTGTPTLLLSNGKAASYSGGSGGSSLIFEYVAQAGDGAGDLSVVSLSLGADGGIADTSGNALAGTVAGGLGLSLDTGALVSVSPLGATKAEGSGGGTTAFTFTLTRTGDTSVPHSVSWSVSGSGAVAADPQDFSGSTLNGGSVTFA
ncbi:beta strand repeat-containing protein, partial [Reyranella sp.]|uniref:beta strand repeat-containing protein n=1 Tax=Reyranella sp. TaxID=1929291 RepID=UPI003D0DB8D4